LLNPPNDFNVVLLELAIGRQDQHVFSLRLCDQHAVERVGVMMRQLCDAKGMAELDCDRIHPRFRKQTRHEMIWIFTQL
jgi:hypothetical protein